MYEFWNPNYHQVNQYHYIDCLFILLYMLGFTFSRCVTSYLIEININDYIVDVIDFANIRCNTYSGVLKIVGIIKLCVGFIFIFILMYGKGRSQ